MGGRLQFFLCNWRRISQDAWILDTIKGLKLEFLSEPHQRRKLIPSPLSQGNTQALDTELDKLFDKRAIEPTHPDHTIFVSHMFVVPKADGSWRPIIDLRLPNQHVMTRHFKMESIRTAKGLLQRDDWLVKLDLKDAYLTVPLHSSHRNFLAFRWRGQLWRFRTLPFGLSSAQYTFTKLMKPVVAILRKLGFRLILYLDDMLVMAQTQEEIKKGLTTALILLTALGFVVNMKKSVIHPTQEIEFLGFVLNTRSMSISLPQQKLKSLRQAATQLRNQGRGSIRQLAQLLGMMVAAHPAILPAPLFYRHLERAKSMALQEGRMYESVIEVNPMMKEDLDWWIHQMSSHNGRPLQVPQWDLIIETDASRMGWGACCRSVRTGGPWTPQEKQEHINLLELLAVFLAVKSFATNQRSIKILLRVDNITAIAFLNRMGGTASWALSNLATDIWKWCLERDILLHAEHLPGKENVRADWESRHVRDSGDWTLHRELFTHLEDRLGPFTIDLFASRTKAQLPVYAAGAQTQQP